MNNETIVIQEQLQDITQNIDTHSSKLQNAEKQSKAITTKIGVIETKVVEVEVETNEACSIAAETSRKI